MFKKSLVPLLAAGALLGSTLAAAAQTTMSTTAPMAGQSAPAMNGTQMGETAPPRSFPGLKMGSDHGMPEGTMGGDGPDYTGKPDLQAAISLVTAGGAPGHFSIVKALTELAGAATANAEVAKLTKQYGAAAVTSFVAVQNFAVDDAVQKALAAGVKFPKPTLTGKTLAVRVVTLGLVNGTYYEGTQLDHLVTHDIHEAVMGDIDQKFGMAADANYHRIADQAHYDLAQALGAKSVKLAAYH